jgi:hypothetical protein
MDRPTSLERTLTKQVINTLMFLEDTPDDEIDPDVAVRQMEDIAFLVRGLDGPDRAIFVGAVQALADAADEPWRQRSLTILAELIRD